MRTGYTQFLGGGILTNRNGGEEGVLPLPPTEQKVFSSNSSIFCINIHFLCHFTNRLGRGGGEDQVLQEVDHIILLPPDGDNSDGYDDSDVEEGGEGSKLTLNILEVSNLFGRGGVYFSLKNDDTYITIE